MEKGELVPRAPKGWLAVQCGVRFAKTLTSFAVLCAVICLLAAASFLVTIGIIIFGVFLIIGSLGTIFIIDPDFGSKFLSAIENTSLVTQALTEYWPVAVGVGLGCAAAAILIFACIKTEKHTSHIVVCSIMAVIMLIAAFLLGVVFQV